MNDGLSSVFKLLCEKGFFEPDTARCCFSFRPGARMISLMEEIAEEVTEYCVQQNVTDWPFEYFWNNPYEPRHSKLLGYFLNPVEKHGCGVFLLQKFFDVLKEVSCFPAEGCFNPAHCQVSVESDRIDILIECHQVDGKFAIIIENKINNAIDQEDQLQRYFQKVLCRGFEPQQVYIIYLPLTSAKGPNQDDLEALWSYGMKDYRKITFDTHILRWLDSAIEGEWPKGRPLGMRDNLSHYRNLIRYLVKSHQEQTMNENILKALARADADNSIPSWSQVQVFRHSANALQKCLEMSLRGKLLLKIREILQRDEADAYFFSEKLGFPEGTPITSEYDQRFEYDQNICLRVNDEVSVCFGAAAENTLGDNDIFWIGYLKTGDASRQEVYADLVRRVEEGRLKRLEFNTFWYAWDWVSEVSYENCLNEEVGARFAKTLLEMKGGLAALFAETPIELKSDRDRTND